MLANKLVNIPSALFRDSITKVLHQELVDRKNKNIKFLPIFMSTLKQLIVISLPFTIGIFFLSPILFSLIFGPNWTLAGDIAQKLSLIFFVSFIVSPLSIIFTVTMELHILAIWQYCHLIFTSIIFFITYIIGINFNFFINLIVINEVILYYT